MPSDGGLGTALVGERIDINGKSVAVINLLGEGGFSYVYLCKEIADTNIGQTLHHSAHGVSETSKDAKTEKRRAGSASGGKDSDKSTYVLKVTSIHSRAQREIAEREAKLLSHLSHPSIIKMFDTTYRQPGSSGSSFRGKDSSSKPQHIMLLEYCEGGTALDVCNKLAAAGKRFELSTLIIAFGQICNAVSYLHAQRPPIVHRDLKPVNFLVKNGGYKLIDFGSSVFGQTDLRTPKARSEAEEVIEKTTTQMFRAPEMVDLYSAKKLTQATDVWALGCCLYSLAFLRNCFEEGSNLAILSRKYVIPDDNPYGDGLVELLDRMLTVDPKARSDMTEVILCLSAVYSGRPLPARKKSSKPKKSEGKEETRSSAREKGDDSSSNKHRRSKKPAPKEEERRGAFRTNGQGIYQEDNQAADAKKKESKKLPENSAAARRRKQAAEAARTESNTTETDVGFEAFGDSGNAFSSSADPFFQNSGEDGNNVFEAFGNTGGDDVGFQAFEGEWENAESGDFSGYDEDKGKGKASKKSGSESKKGGTRRRQKSKDDEEGLDDSFNDMAMTSESETSGRKRTEKKNRTKKPSRKDEDPSSGPRRTKSHAR